MQGVALQQFVVADLRQTVAAVQHLEEQFVTLLAILTHQRLQRLHSRCLYLGEAIEGIHVADGIENIVALGHLHGAEIARSFGNTGFH